MLLSQLLITLDSFQSLPLAGATLLKRDGIWAERRCEGGSWRAVCVCADLAWPRVRGPLPGRGVLPKGNLSRPVGSHCQVQCLRQHRMAALASGVSSSGRWDRI